VCVCVCLPGSRSHYGVSERWRFCLADDGSKEVRLRNCFFSLDFDESDFVFLSPREIKSKSWRMDFKGVIFGVTGTLFDSGANINIYIYICLYIYIFLYIYIYIYIFLYIYTVYIWYVKTI